MEKTEKSYSVKKSLRNGWRAESNISNVNGYDWQITTLKRSSGKISCIAQSGKDSGEGSSSGFTTFSYMMFSNPMVTLASMRGNATEANVTKVHTMGLANFDQLLENGDLPLNSDMNDEVYEIKVGQWVWTEGYDNRNERIIYHIETLDNGSKHYHTIQPEGMKLRVDTRLKNIKNKFGIATYYKEGDVFEDIDKLNDMVITAKQLEKIETEKRQIANETAKKEKAEKIAKGKEIVNIPEGTQGVILGEYKVDDCDPMTDYFSSHTEKLVVLAWSNHERDLFSEMRKAAKNCPETETLADAPKEYEHREKYSMGRGYYLAKSGYSGWNIKKYGSWYLKDSYLENIYIAAAEGRYFAE